MPEFTEETSILILGAGPTGLGAATRLHQHGFRDWLMVDAASKPGGLASTDLTPEGFFFDIGGHVIFSHYDYFDQLLDYAVGTGPDQWAHHQRVTNVFLKNRFVPYPFQNNLSCLSVDDQVLCLNGLIRARLAAAAKPFRPTTFDEWILTTMGEGIANIFMRPYNFKVWATPTTQMQCGWLGERVATIDLEKTIGNVLYKKTEAGWGPNATFRFPQDGGTGAIWTNVAALLPEQKQRYNTRVVALDPDRNLAATDSGDIIKYQKLLSTMPLDVLLRMFNQDTLANRLSHSSTNVIGIGLRGKSSHIQGNWLYYPEDNCPFYRANIFSNFGRGNVPSENVLLRGLGLASDEDLSSDSEDAKPGPYWSIMMEVSESTHKPVNRKTLVQDTIRGALAVGLLLPDDEIVSVHLKRMEHGYPIPTLERDEALNIALPWLRQRNIWSRGRFGAFKYEVANQDHSLMQGVEAVDNMLFDTEELTLNKPDYVNSGAVKNRVTYQLNPQKDY